MRTAACVAALGVSVVVGALSYFEWQGGIADLQRDNLTLELKQLAASVMAQSDELAHSAREVAESNVIAQFAQDGTMPPAQSMDMGHVSFDSLLIVPSTRGSHYGAAMVRGRLAERAADPALLSYVEALGSHAVSPVGIVLGFVGDQLVAACPIPSRNGSAAMGWVVLGRSLSSAMSSELAKSVSSAIHAHTLRQLDLDDVPKGVRKALLLRSPTGFGVTTQMAGRQFGYVIVHDQAGKPAWIFETLPPSAAFSWAVAGIALSLVGALSAAAFLLLQHYLQQQRSVDARYKAIIDQTHDGIVIVDATANQVQYCNPAFLARVGYTGEEALALTLTDLFADGEAPADSVLARLRNADSKLAMNVQQRCKDGALVDIEVRCNALDVAGRDVLAYVTHDVSVRRKVEQQLIDNQLRLERMAHHDQLTSLPNRHYLASFLPQAIAEAKATDSMLGVVFLDLDRFKHINDTRGHETGDKLLQEVASRLRACVRDTDVIIRMGGDEFVVVFRNVKSYDEVTQGAGRILNTLSNPIIIDQHPLQTSGSVGVSLFPRDGADMGELLKHSDTAMYQAKDRGRNNVQMFSPIMNRKLNHRVAMEASLREALRLKQLEVHYQPFVNLATRKIVGLEALMRWRHPQHGMIPADKFIPVAEESGLIVPMGNFVLHRTLQTMSAWRKAGVALVPVSLNVAPAQLLRGEFQATISTLLKTHGMRPGMLQLEMTERAVFDSSRAKAGENQKDTMGRLRDMGIKIAIDDFGTGYSSLSYLKNWRVDALKIDRSFVRDLVTDSSDLAIVSAIIAIARHLNIQVIAEGIEAYQQADILQKLGCTIGQGFLFAKPMPAEECRVLLGDNTLEQEEEEDMLAAFASGGA
jgi:diguanylate cyclase (GGDEF)-like protein/PAS domain S-box-containing protein